MDLSKTGPPKSKRKSSLFPVQFKYIFPAGGLLKSSPNTFVKKKLRKVKLKTRNFCALKGALRRAFLIKVIFPFWGGFFDRK
jgi:hypothetical protein